MIYDLPRSVTFGGREWEINTDFRDVLTVLEAFEDVDLTDTEKAYVCLYNLYLDYEEIPAEHMQDAFDAAVRFIDCGGGREPHGARTMDWTQDAPLIFSAVNHVAGCEVRALEYLHWWTFIGYFMEIKDSTASTVFSLRQKKARGKKLEKHEREYWDDNRDICEIKSRYTEAEKAEIDKLNAILG